MSDSSLSPAAAPPFVPPRPGRTIDHVSTLYGFMPTTLTGNLVGIVLVLVLMVGMVPAWQLGLWLLAAVVLLAGRAWHTRGFGAVNPQRLEPPEVLRWYHRWVGGTLLSGLLWAMAMVMFYGRGGAIQEMGLILIVFGYCVAAVPMLSDQPRVFQAFLLICFVPGIGRMLWEGRLYDWQLAGLLLLIMGLTSLLGRNYRQSMLRMMELKQRADELLDALRQEKAAADHARREAEAANRAKTQFFSAASHDLRQPLHAMVLFAEALRQKNTDAEVAQLINSINGSVDALEGLFSELLDITRIDSGGIDVNPQHFALRDVFTRMKLHFEPIAFEKGLGLSFKGGRHYAFGDPVLVERILRNLLSNALRYTEDGGALVSCRRRGDQLLLQVWDSGIGISPEAMPRIFDEFYQVGGVRRLEPHQRKGLGLGLAIVKRLAGLMNADLQVRSVAGRGSVFTLVLPCGAEPQLKDPLPTLRPAMALTLSGQRIVIVEDEPSVLEGLQVLLRSWGAQVLGFDSLAAARPWLDSGPTERPQLLIVDYRLPDGVTGVDVIRAMREVFGPGLSAIVVTGSTLAGHDEEAQAHDFHLMYKPVVPTKLRAMIAFKLGLRGLGGGALAAPSPVAR
jgi:signal transduction histidine kinase/CheY-like chemotaxis protein